jgi:hypothetical protein
MVAVRCWFHFNRWRPLHCRKYLFVAFLTIGALKIFVLDCEAAFRRINDGFTTLLPARRPA